MEIKPTIGRVVWFYPAGHREGEQPHAALIAFVHSDSMINIGAIDPNGRSYNQTSVPLIHDGTVPDGGRYATWMPFQIGQAKKAETEPATTEQAQPVADTAAQAADAESIDGSVLTEADALADLNGTPRPE